MPIVSDLLNAFAPSFDSRSSNHLPSDEEDDTAMSPVRYVREGQYDTKFDAEQARRHYKEKRRRRRRTLRTVDIQNSDSSSLAENSTQSQESSTLFSVDFSTIDGESTTFFSNSTTRDSSWEQSRFVEGDTRSFTRDGSLDGPRSELDCNMLARESFLGTGRSNENTKRDSPPSPLLVNEWNRPTWKRSSKPHSVQESSAGRSAGIDSLAEVLDNSFETEAAQFLSSVTEEPEQETEYSAAPERITEYSAASSAARMASQSNTRRKSDKHSPRAKSRESKAELNDSLETPSENTYASVEEAARLALHDLCSEATSPDDVAWRNALHLLSIHPHLAYVSDDGGWTPLHVCCLGVSPPPLFMVRALLLCHWEGARVVDKGGRLPLHMAAASSADPATIKMLVEEYPQAVFKTDKRGMTPLHMLLKNEDAKLTVEQIRILLGQVESKEKTPTRDHVLQRRGEHLHLQVDEINRMANQWSSSNSALNPRNEDGCVEREMQTYPDDVQACFRKLAQWRRKLRRKNNEAEEAIEVELDSTRNGEETNAAAIAMPSTLQMPLHLAVARHFPADFPRNDEFDVANPPASQYEILRVIVSAHPEALVTRDAYGRTPLATALVNEGHLPSLPVVQLLLGMHTMGYESPLAWANDQPLQRTFPGAFKNPAMMPTLDTNQLPLHIAAEEMPSFATAIVAIYSSYPGAVHVQDLRGRTPLHTALRNYQMIEPDPQVLSLLLGDRVAQIRDGDGFLPFDLLVKASQNLPPREPRPVAWSGNPDEPSDVYKRFFTSIIVQSPRPRNRAEATEYLQRIRVLPPWIRRQACSAGFVQDLLIEELSSLVKCSLILFCIAVLGGLIITFRLQLDEFSSGSEVTSSYAPVIFTLATVLLLGQSFHWQGSAWLSVFTTQCALNIWSWIDLAAAVLAIVTTYLIHDGSNDVDLIADLGAASTGLLWCNLVGYMARSWHGMAVFFGGIKRIGSVLLWPLIALAVLIVSFAQMLYTINVRNGESDCRDALAGWSLCNVRDSYIVVYQLFLGTALVDTETEETLNAGSIMLIVLFTIFFAILVVNMIIVVVVEASTLQFVEIALSSFWEPTLNFVYMSWDWASYAYWFRARRWRKDKDDDVPAVKRKLMYNLSAGERFSLWLQQMWEVVCLAIQGGDKGRRKMWYMGCHTTNRPSLIAWLTRILALLVLPVWLVLGLATFGILWPPQVRRWLFRPSKARSHSSKNTDGSSGYSVHQVAGLRSELMHLKTMYEKSNNVETEIRELKELLYAAMQED